MNVFGRIAALSLALVLGTAPAWAQEKNHIQVAQEFLIGWGQKNWDAITANSGGKVTVKVGGTAYTLDPEGKQADAELVFPFRGLSAVRVEGKVKGVTVEEITVRAGGAERKGKGTVTLEERDGTFRVAGVAVE